MAARRLVRGDRLARRQLLLRTTSGEDYYRTPAELGYGGFVKFDHDFTGREALEGADEPTRRKVTLAWNGEDVAEAIGTLFEKGDPAKYIDIPLSNYSTWPNDRLMHGDRMVGVSTFSGYSYNERSYLSLGVVDNDIEIGQEIVLVWGEENGVLGEAGRRAPSPGRDPGGREPGSVR